MRASLFVILISVLLLTFWQYQPSTVLTARQPFKVVAVEDRTLVVLDANYCKRVNVRGVVRVSFVSKTSELFTPMASEPTPTGCHEDQKLPILLPSDIPPGEYYVKFNATYRVNPIRTFNLIITSDQFEVK